MYNLSRLKIPMYFLISQQKKTGWAELGAPGIPRGPHLFGIYVIKESKFDIFRKKTKFPDTWLPCVFIKQDSWDSSCINVISLFSWYIKAEPFRAIKQQYYSEITVHILLHTKLHSNKKEGRRRTDVDGRKIVSRLRWLLRMVIKANFCLLSSMHLRVEKGQHSCSMYCCCKF